MSNGGNLEMPNQMHVDVQFLLDGGTRWEERNKMSLQI
jgi:hypothetical protein